MLLAATDDGIVRDGELVLPGVRPRVFAATGTILLAGGDGVVRSLDGGETWASCGLEGARVRSLAAAPGLVLAGLKPARVGASRDEGATWTPLAPFPRRRSWFWATPAERPFRQAAVHGLAIVAGSIVAGIEAGALVVSRDDGATWSGHRRAAFRDCHDLAVAAGRVFLAGARGGCAVSGDGGETWRRLKDGLGGWYGWSVAADDRAGVFLFAGRGPARPGFVHRLERERWQKVTEEVPGFVWVAAGGGLVCASVGEEVWSSGDRGDSWERRRLGHGRVRALLIA